MAQSETISYLDREILKVKLYLQELNYYHPNMEFEPNSHNQNVTNLLKKLEFEREIIMSKTNLR